MGEWSRKEPCRKIKKGENGSAENQSPPDDPKEALPPIEEGKGNTEQNIFMLTTSEGRYDSSSPFS
jgi:hypothetical protein